MRYRELEPCPALRGRVRYWRLSGDGGAGAASEPVLPDGLVELVVHLGDPFRIERGGASELQPRVLVAGPGTRPVRLAPGGRVDVIGVRLEAGVVAELVDARPEELVDRLPALDEVAPRLARGLAEELAEARGDGWAAALDRRLASALARSAQPPRPDPVAGVIARLRASGGRLGIAQLASEANLSTRTLERRFRARVGLGPKTFARLVRFQRALGLLRGPRVALADVAARCGYFDHAHLVRDFRQFAEDCPSRFLAAPSELAGHFVDAAP